MNNLDLFYLTDGNEYVNLRSKQSGIFLRGWQPGIQEPRGGGVWQESPMSDGRVLVARPSGNATEQLSLMIGSGGQDATIYDTQVIRRFLEKAVNYSLTVWQTAPVWIMCRARRETNVRYAIILDYRAPGENNPFAETFDSDTPLITNFPLILERGDWLSNPPGEAECLPVSTESEASALLSYSPLQASDDAYIDDNALIHLITTTIKIGNINATGIRAGFRFPGVALPQGANILSAIIRLMGFSSVGASPINLRIRGEAVDDAPTFTTKANFLARTETTAFVDWSNLTINPGQISSTPNLAGPVQEIINRAGWASGNDLVIFLDDNGSAGNRSVAAFENNAYPAAILEITYNADLAVDTLGQESTCENANYVSNRRSGVMTHVYYYDDSTASFSANLLTAALPYALLPATPGVGDIIYFISETANPLNSPPSGLVFDLQTAMSDVEGVFEYYNSVGPWDDVNTTYAPQFTDQPFQMEGINSIHTRPPVSFNPMLPTTINGITGWIFRFRVTSVGAAPVAPVQQNRLPYALGWNEIFISDADLGGDLPPLVNLKLYNRSDNGDALTGAVISSQRVILGARLVARGDRFTSVINLGDLQNPDGIAITPSTLTAFDDDVGSPTGRVSNFSPGAASALGQRVSVSLDTDITQHYKGVFKPYLRVKQVGGANGDMAARLRIGLSSISNIIYTSETIYTTGSGEPEIFEFKEFTLPPYLDILKDSESISGVFFLIDALNTNNTPPDLYLIDLFLIPVDEFSLDTYHTLFSPAVGINATDGLNRMLEIDSATRLKRQYSSTLMLEKGPVPLLNYFMSANGTFTLQPSGDQKIHFLFARVNSGNGWDSYPEIAMSLQIHLQKRYFSMRGNR